MPSFVAAPHHGFLKENGRLAGDPQRIYGPVPSGAYSRVMRPSSVWVR